MKTWASILAVRSNQTWLKSVVCLAVILGSVASFGYNGIVRAVDLDSAPGNQSVDFYQFYTIGRVWADGANAYDYSLYRRRFGEIAGARATAFQSGDYYPPQASVLFSALTWFGVEDARLLVIQLNAVLALAAVVMLGAILSWYRSLNLLDVTFLAALLNTGFARRNIREGQVGLLIFVLILAMFVFAQRRRWLPAALSLAAISIKPTFIPIYLGYYLVRRSYRMVVLTIVAGLIFTIAPLVLTGRPAIETIGGWVSTLRTAADDVNDPSPFSPYSVLMLHLPPLIYRIFNAYTPTTTAIAILITIALCVSSIYLVWRVPRSNEQDLLDFGLVSALSLLAVYHRQYDIFMLLPGLLYIYYYATSGIAVDRYGWSVFLVGVLGFISLPGDLFPARLPAYVPAQYLDTYFMRLLAPFPTWAALAVLIALLYLKLGSLGGHSPPKLHPQDVLKTSREPDRRTPRGDLIQGV